MEMVAFYSKFPKIAEKETRSITVVDESIGLKKGEYGFLELFCNDQNFKGVDELIRAQQLGHSLSINHRHYSGSVDEDMLKALSKLKSASGDNLIPFIRKEQSEQDANPSFHPSSGF